MSSSSKTPKKIVSSSGAPKKNKHATDHKKTVGSKQEVVKDRYKSSATKGVVPVREEKHKTHHHLDVHNHVHHHARVDVHHHIYHKPCQVVIKYESKEKYHPGISVPIHWWKK